MKKGLLKADQITTEKMVKDIQSHFKKLLEFLREKHELAEEWLNDLDYRIDTIESLKKEENADFLKIAFGEIK